MIYCDLVYHENSKTHPFWSHADFRKNSHVSCLNLLCGVHHHLSVELLEIAYGNKAKRVCSIVCSNQAVALLQQRVCVAFYTLIDVWVSFGVESSDTRWKVLRWCHGRTASNPCGISSGTLSGWNNLKYVLSFGWNDGNAGIKLHGPYDRLHCEAIG